MDWHAPDATTVFEYLEGTLPTPEQQAFEAHVRDCPSCQEELRAARRLEDLGRNWTQVEPPPQLLEKIRRQLKPQVPARAWLLAVAAGTMSMALMSSAPTVLIERLTTRASRAMNR